MEDSKTLFCVSKFPWARGRISSKFVVNLGTRPQKRSPALPYGKNIIWKYICSCLYRALMTIITLYYPTDAQIYNS